MFGLKEEGESGMVPTGVETVDMVSTRVKIVDTIRTKMSKRAEIGLIPIPFLHHQ